MVWIEIRQVQFLFLLPWSPPARVVWIEMVVSKIGIIINVSPPARVVWIEIPIFDESYRNVLVATREGGVD